MYEWITIPLWLLSLVAMYAIMEFGYLFRKYDAYVFRAFSHFYIGGLVVIHPISMRLFPYIEIVVFSVVAMLILAYKNGRMRSAIRTKKHLWGSIFFALGLYITFTLWRLRGNTSFLYYYLPVMIMIYADQMASILGRLIPYRQYKVGSGYKTLTGVITFFTIGIILSFIFISYNRFDSGMSNIVLASVFVSLSGTLAEAFTAGKYDNITVPMASLLGIYIADIVFL